MHPECVTSTAEYVDDSGFQTVRQPSEDCAELSLSMVLINVRFQAYSIERLESEPQDEHA